MELEHCNFSFFLTIVMFTWTGTYWANTIKNSIANTNEYYLREVGAITIINYSTLKKVIGTLTKCYSLFVLLLITAIIESIMLLGLFLYSELEGITNWLLLSIEAIISVFYAMGIIILIVSIVIVFLSPRQHLLSDKWNIP